MVKVKSDTYGAFHHLPDHQEEPQLKGKSLRQALVILREMDFGSIGGSHFIELSDGSYFDVDLTPASDNSRLMNSQRVSRYEWENSGERLIRRYKL